MTRRRFVQIDGELVEVGLDYTPDPRAEHHVIPDIEPFRDPSGTFISGRAAWRSHLAATNTVEMGHSDVAAQQAAFAKRREAHAAKVARAGDTVSDAPVLEGRRSQPRILGDVLNRLEGRPVPPRKTLIKIALEEARRRR